MATYDAFLRRICNLGGFDSPDRARTVVEAVGKTLSERLPAQERQRVSSALPEEVADFFSFPDGGQQEVFGIEEFFERVSSRAHEEVPETVRQVRAVAEAVAETVPAEVMNDVYKALPDDIRQLFYAGPPPGSSVSEGNSSAGRR